MIDGYPGKANENGEERDAGRDVIFLSSPHADDASRVKEIKYYMKCITRPASPLDDGARHYKHRAGEHVRHDI